MNARVDVAKVVPRAMHVLVPTSKYVKSSGLDRRLLELVHLRTSQLNGCASSSPYPPSIPAAGDPLTFLRVAAGQVRGIERRRRFS
jgi:hypothetical protein